MSYLEGLFIVQARATAFTKKLEGLNYLITYVGWRQERIEEKEIKLFTSICACKLFFLFPTYITENIWYES